MTRPDQENINSLLNFLASLNYGETLVKIGVVKKHIAYWEEQSSKRGHKAPLQKEAKLEDDG